MSSISFDLAGAGQDAFVHGGRENLRRRCLHAAFRRQPCLPPGGDAAIEDGDVLYADIFQRPVGARGRTEIENVHARRHHDNMAVLVDAEIADQLFEFRRGRHHERHIVARNAPAGLVVVTVNAAWNMRGRVSRRAAAVDRGTDVEDDQVGIGTMGIEPLGGDQRFCMRTGDRNHHGRTEQHRGTETPYGPDGIELEECFHGADFDVGKPPQRHERLPLK